MGCHHVKDFGRFSKLKLLSNKIVLGDSLNLVFKNRKKAKFTILF